MTMSHRRVDPTQFLPVRLREALGHVLADLHFPATRGEVLLPAAEWRVSTMVRTALLALPDATYDGPEATLGALAASYRPHPTQTQTQTPPSVTESVRVSADEPCPRAIRSAPAETPTGRP